MENDRQKPLAYVAGYFQHKGPVQEMQSRLIHAGWIISHDWTNENADGLSGQALTDYLRKCAVKDFHGVLDADLCVVMHETEGGCGMWTEMGFAAAHGIPVIAVGGHVPVRPDLPGLPRNIFYLLPRVYVVPDMDAAMAKADMIMELWR